MTACPAIGIGSVAGFARRRKSGLMGRPFDGRAGQIHASKTARLRVRLPTPRRQMSVSPAPSGGRSLDHKESRASLRSCLGWAVRRLWGLSRDHVDGRPRRFRLVAPPARLPLPDQTDRKLRLAVTLSFRVRRQGIAALHFSDGTTVLEGANPLAPTN